MKKKSTKKKAADRKRSEKLRKEALAVTDRNLARIEAQERGETVARSNGGGAKNGVKKQKTQKGGKAPKAKRISALDAAVQVLKASKDPMNTIAMIEAMRAKRLWSPPKAGKTPHATLYSAILREIQVKGREARFQKVERGLFTLRKGA